MPPQPDRHLLSSWPFSEATERILAAPELPILQKQGHLPDLQADSDGNAAPRSPYAAVRTLREPRRAPASADPAQVAFDAARPAPQLDYEVSCPRFSDKNVKKTAWERTCWLDTSGTGTSWLRGATETTTCEGMAWTKVTGLASITVLSGTAVTGTTATRAGGGGTATSGLEHSCQFSNNTGNPPEVSRCCRSRCLGSPRGWRKGESRHDNRPSKNRVKNSRNPTTRVCSSRKSHTLRHDHTNPAQQGQARPRSKNIHNRLNEHKPETRFHRENPSPARD